MKTYAKKIKNRMTADIVGAVALTPLAVFTAYHYFMADEIISGTPVKDFIGGFFNGVRSVIVAGFIFILVVNYLKYRKAYKDETMLKEMQIIELDERTVAIKEHSSRLTFNIIIYVIMAASLIFGLFNATISVTLLITWVFIVLVRIFSAGYYEKKM